MASSTRSGGGPQPVTLAIGLRLTPSAGSDAKPDDPAADAAPVQRHAHHRADAHPVRQLGRHEVVEGLVEAADVGQDASDQRRGLEGQRVSR